MNIIKNRYPDRKEVEVIRRMTVLCLLVCVFWAMKAEAQWGPGGGGPGGGRRGQGGENRGRFEEMRAKMEALNACNVEAMWAVLCFGVGLTPEQLDPLRGPFAEAWNKRTSILEMAEKADKPDWGAYRDELKEMKKDLDQKTKALLNEEQQKAFSKQMKAYENALPRFRGGGAPGGGE